MAFNYSWYAEINIGTEASPDWYHLPQGILKSFNCSVNATAKSGEGSFYISDKNNALWDELSALTGNGANQELRFYFGDKNNFDFVFGGYIRNPIQPKRHLNIFVDHYVELLGREVSVEDYYEDQVGSYMVADSTDGLIPKYFSGSDQINIDTSNHVDAEGNQTGAEFTYDADGMNIMTAMKEIAKKTRKYSGGIGAIPYDFYVNYCPTHDQKEIWFNVKNDTSFASGVTLNEGVDFKNNFGLEEDTSNIINYWYVRGENKTPCPIDMDWWTEFDSDAAARNVWSSSNCTIYDDGVDIIGNRSIRVDVTSSGLTTASATLDMTDGTNAYDSTYTPDEIFSQNNGYTVDFSKNQYVNFYIMTDNATKTIIQDEDALIRAEIEIDSTSSNYPSALLLGNGSFLADTPWTKYSRDLYFENAQWYKWSILLTDIVDSNTDYIEKLRIEIEWDSGVGSGGDEDFYIDGVHFWDDSPVQSTAATDATSISTYGRRKQIYNSRNIRTKYSGNTVEDGNTKAMCNTIADRLVEQTAEPLLNVTLPLTQYKQIEPRETFTLNIPSRDINNETFRCVAVKYSPQGQVIEARNSSYYQNLDFDIGELVAGMQRQLNESGRRK